MKRFLTLTGALVILLLGAALIVPSFLDWNQYKGEIATQVKKATGRDITIGGDLKMSFLPAPTLSVEDLHLANPKGSATTDLVSLEALDVRVALRPLFDGKVEVESVSLVAPIINLEVYADGSNNWTLVPEKTAAESQTGSQAGAGDDVAAKGGEDVKVTLERAAIKNAVLTFRDARAGTFEKITGLTADITAESLSGPFEAEGAVTLRSIPLIFKASSGSLQDARSLSVSLDLGMKGVEGKVAVSGAIADPLADQTFNGKIHVEGASLADILAAVMAPGSKITLPGALSGPVMVEGLISGDASSIDLNEVSFTLGGLKANGGLNAELGEHLRAGAALAFGRVDLDQILSLDPVTITAARKVAAPSEGSSSDSPSGEAAKDGKAAKSAKTTAPKAKASGKTGAFGLPVDLAASVSVSAQAVIYNGKVIQKMSAEALVDKGRINISKVTSQLPGNTQVSVSGVLSQSKGAPSFNGALKLASDNLRGAMEWLKLPVPGIPADRLRRLVASSKISGTPTQVTLSGLDATLDSTRIKGGVAIALRKRPAFGISLDVDKLNLDAYLPKDTVQKVSPKAVDTPPTDGGEKAAEKTPAKTPVNTQAPLMAALASLSAFDANIKAKVAQLTINKLPVEGATLDATLQAGKLTVREAGIRNFAGAGVKVSGDVSQDGDAPKAALAYDLRTKDPSRLFRVLGLEAPPYVSRLGQVVASGRLEGALENMQLTSAFDLAGGKVTLSGRVNVLSANPALDLGLTLNHANLTRFARIFAPDYRPAAVNLGGLSLKAALKGNADRFTLSGVDAKVGPVALSGGAEVTLSGERPYLNATLASSEIVTDLFLPVPEKSLGLREPDGGYGLPGYGLAGVIPAAAKTRAKSTPVKTARWSREALDLSALAGVDADIKLAAAGIAYDKYHVVNPQVVMALKNGTLDVQRMAGKLFEGVFDMRTRLLVSGPPSFSSVLTVKGANIKQALFAAGNVNVADGRLDFQMDANGNGRSVYEIVSSLAGKGNISVADGVVEGFDLTTVSERLKKLDDALGFLSLLQSSMSGGRTRFSSLTGTFNMEKGIITTKDVLLVAKAGKGQAAGVIDLPRWLLDVKGEFYLTEHPKAPPFGMTLSGSMDNPRRKFDIERLQAFLLQRGVGTLLRKVVPTKEGSVIDQILGGALPGTTPKSAPAPATTEPAPAPETQPAPAQPQEVKPEDAIKGLLKGLFK